MNENYLAKWLNNELSEEEQKAFEASAEYASYQKIAEASKQLKAPEFDTAASWKAITATREKKETKVIPLFTWQKVMRYAAVFALLVTATFSI